MKVSKKKVVALFKALGFHTSANWTLDRLQEKINKLTGFVEDNVTLDNPKAQAFLDEVKANQGNIEVVDPDAPEMDEGAKPEPAVEKGEPKEEAEAEAEVETKEVAKPEKKKPKAPRKSSVERDRFGTRKGSQASIINEVIKDKNTIKEVAEAADVSNARVSAHFKHLVKKGFLVKEGDTYVLNQNEAPE